MENYPKIFELAKYINYCYALAAEKSPDFVLDKCELNKSACLQGIKRCDFVDCYNQLNNAIKISTKLRNTCPYHEDEIDIFTQKLTMIQNSVEIVLENEFGVNLNKEEQGEV